MYKPLHYEAGVMAKKKNSKVLLTGINCWLATDWTDFFFFFFEFGDQLQVFVDQSDSTGGRLLLSKQALSDSDDLQIIAIWFINVDSTL